MIVWMAHYGKYILMYNMYMFTNKWYVCYTWGTPYHNIYSYELSLKEIMGAATYSIKSLDHYDHYDFDSLHVAAEYISLTTVCIS